MKFPENLKYSNDHEWISLDGDVATIGITEFAQGELGDIVFIDIDTEGDDLSTGDVFGTIEAVKTVSDLFMPVSGVVTEINNSLEDEPEKVNESPYEGGWIIKVKISDESEFNGLLSHEEYTKLVGS